MILTLSLSFSLSLSLSLSLFAADVVGKVRDLTLLRLDGHKLKAFGGIDHMGKLKVVDLRNNEIEVREEGRKKTGRRKEGRKEGRKE